MCNCDACLQTLGTITSKKTRMLKVSYMKYSHVSIIKIRYSKGVKLFGKNEKNILILKCGRVGIFMFHFYR